MQQAISPVFRSAFIEIARDGTRQVGGDPSAFDPFKPTIETFLDSRTERVAQEVNEETERQLRAALTESVTAGESTFEARARLEAIFGANATMRADRMAQYQMTRIMSQADIEAWEQSGVVEAKQWYTAHDDRVCIGCNHMDGKTTGLRDAYFKKGDTLTVGREDDKPPYKLEMGYEDVTGCPLHNRCRCVLLAVRKTS